MKILITALLGALAALPLLIGQKKTRLIPINGKSGQKPNEREENLRYDVDDFLTQ